MAEAFSPQTTPPPLPKTDEDSTSFRRNLTGKKASSNSGEKAVPRYLRASTGSCHDFCKFGHKHAIEEQAKRPIPRRVAAKPKDSYVSVDSAASLGRKKASPSVAKVMKSSPEAPNMTRSLDRPSFVENHVRGERKKTSLARLKGEAAASSAEKNSARRSSSANSKSSSAKLVPSWDASGGSNGKIGKRAVSSKLASTRVSSRHSLGGVAGLNEKDKSSEKVVSRPLDARNGAGEAEPARPGNDGVEEKTLYVIKTATEGSLLDANRVEHCAREIEHVVEVENGDSALEWDQSEHCAREVEYVDKVETEEISTLELDRSETCDVLVESLPHSSSSSLPNEEEEEEEDQEEFEYTMSEYDDDTYSENSEFEIAENSETLGTSTEMSKGPGTVRAEDEDEKAWKMKFRRGTVVEVQAEDNAPRRLRFRRGRFLDGGDVGGPAEGRRRRFKRREGSDENGAGNGAERVVLKHQGVQGRKDAQGLFNNVIEETASKLVEARKSKVKALVGAFETVISLQDGIAKPSSNTTAS